MYKIVRNVEGVQWSMFPSSLEISYNIDGMWTQPPEKYVQCGYGILTFLRILDACKFILMFGTRSWTVEIWDIDVGNLMPLPENSIHVAKLMMQENYALENEYVVSSYEWPRGTQMYDTIKMKQLVAVFPSTTIYH